MYQEHRDNEEKKINFENCVLFCRTIKKEKKKLYIIQESHSHTS
jgi:hypothetical protein